MTEVTELSFSELVQVNPDRINCLVRELGEFGAERVIGRAMEELAVRLARVKCAVDEKDPARVAKGAQGLVAIADQIGMHTLAEVARDVAGIAQTTDSAALAATAHRLGRIGEKSLMAIWDQQDLSV